MPRENPDFTKFPPGDILNPRNPIEVYRLVHDQLTATEAGHNTYISYSLTSGGAIRLNHKPDTEQLPLTIPQIWQLNATFAEQILDLLTLARTLQPNQRVTLPHHLGPQYIESKNKVRSWQEIEFLSFWAMFIIGMTPKEAQSFYNQLTNSAPIDWSIFNNHHAHRADRALQYQKLVDFTIAFIANLPKEKRVGPQQVLRLPDAERSMGATLELAIALGAGIDVHQVVIDPTRTEGYSIQNDPVFQLLVQIGIISSPESPDNSPQAVSLRPVRDKQGFNTIPS